jgi:hypothetical protein
VRLKPLTGSTSGAPASCSLLIRLRLADAAPRNGICDILQAVLCKSFQHLNQVDDPSRVMG